MNSQHDHKDFRESTYFSKAIFAHDELICAGIVACDEVWRNHDMISMEYTRGYWANFSRVFAIARYPYWSVLKYQEAFHRTHYDLME